MRVTKTTGGLKVHAVAGTYVVTFGLNLARGRLLRPAWILDPPG